MHPSRVDICILASGSSGNCTVVRTPAGAMLIDAGIGPRVVEKRLEGTDLKLRDIRAICVTHLDRDHFNNTWFRQIAQAGIRVFCHRNRMQSLLGRAYEFCGDRSTRMLEKLADLVQGFENTEFETIQGLRLQAIRLAHDQLGSHAFVIEGFGCRIGWATDLGHVPDQLIEHFDDLDVVAMESNYDPGMQLNSERPWFLKRRIMGGNGHLSNEQAFEAIRRILNRCEERRQRLPAHIVLLHRSRRCNCPEVVKKYFAQDNRIAPRLTLAEQYRRSRWLRASGRRGSFVGDQLELAWGNLEIESLSQ